MRIEKAKSKARIRGVVFVGLALILGVVIPVAVGLMSVGNLVMGIPIILVSLIVGV